MEARASLAGTSVRARIARNLGVLLGFVVVMLGLTGTTLKQLSNTIEGMLNENLVAILSCIDMDEALERQDDITFSIAHDSEGLPEVSQALTASRNAFEQALQRNATRITLPGEAELLLRIRVRFERYRDLSTQLMNAKLDRRQRRENYQHELRPLFFEIQRDIEKIIALHHAKIEAANIKTQRTAKSVAGVVIGASIAALAIAGWVAWRLLRSLVQPLGQLTDSIHAVEQDDLSRQVPVPTVAELQLLALAVNRMLSRLRVYREQTEGELARARELAQATIECMLDPVIVCDGEQRVLMASGAATVHLGVRQGTLSAAKSASNPIVVEVARACREVLTNGRPVIPQSLSQAVRDASSEEEKYYLVRAWPLHAKPGESPRAIAVAQDITRFRRIDSIKNDMVATVSHEFKTPLTSLLMATHLLLEPATGPLSAMQRDVVLSARADAERLRRMVEELLDLVRIEAEAAEPRRKLVSPTTILQDVMQAHRGLLVARGVSVVVAPPDNEEPVWIPEQIPIVLSNLLTNAITHTPTGGCVNLKAVRASRWVRWLVLDTGSGIAPDKLAEISQGAPSLNRGQPVPGKRPGLGLTIARSIIRQYGGEITVSSTPGSGSLFIVSLPVEE